MIINRRLNRKQQIIAWVMIFLVSMIVIRTTYALPLYNAFICIKTFLYLYSFIFIIGLFLIHMAREEVSLSK